MSSELTHQLEKKRALRRAQKAIEETRLNLGGIEKSISTALNGGDIEPIAVIDRVIALRRRFDDILVGLLEGTADVHGGNRMRRFEKEEES